MSKSRILAFSLLAMIAVGVLAAWQLRPIKHISDGSSVRGFDLECEFLKFRQIMVRKNATKAIVAHGGLTLVKESIDDFAIDTSKDERPLLNAILGKSKSTVDATKTLVVRLDNDQIENEELTLRQVADIDEDRMHVETTSVGEQQSIKRYATVLTATPDGDRTHVDVSIEMKIEVSVPKMFTGQADKQVQKAANDATAEQEAAITAFVIENAGKKFIMPEL